MEKITCIALLNRFLKGETSSAEEQQLLDWFKQPGTKEELFNAYLERWEMTSDALSAETQNRVLQSIRAKIQQTEKKNVEVHTPNHSLFAGLFRYAAVACLLIAVSVGTYVYTRHTLISSSNFVVSAAKGQKANIKLPDGTRVWLNSDTKLTYNNAYNTSERAVTLTGEAYFEVAKNKDKKFIVYANDIRVEALGTAFNVKAYAAENQITTTLLEGKVQVSNRLTSEILYPNERVVYSREKKFFNKTEVYKTSNASSWRNNELAFNNETLEEIAFILERMYNIQIIFDSRTAKQYRFAGTIRNSSLGNVFEIISLTAPIRYTIKGDVVEIKDNL